MKALQVTGLDALTFLQGQCTCDVEALDQRPLLAACCNQKGRMVANYWIHRIADGCCLTLPASMQPILMEHLQRYAVFSKLEIACAHADSPQFVAQNGSMPIWILPETSEQFIPQMINLQQHGGVSFTKGCYLGQEVIARTAHLGQLKRHLYRLTAQEGRVAKVGEKLQNALQQPVGTLVATTRRSLFAVLEDRAVSESLCLSDRTPLPAHWQRVFDCYV